MIDTPTVYVLGAGASWHYGYPTGEELVQSVIQMAGALRSYCETRRSHDGWGEDIPEFVASYISHRREKEEISQAWEKVRNDCDDLISRLTAVQPVVIDFFLGWNEHLQNIGKLLISVIILCREAEWRENRRNLNRKNSIEPAYRRPRPLDPDMWIRFVVHQMMYACGSSNELIRNKVHFITFNYDVSLETALQSALSQLDFLDSKDISNFLSGNRIVHVYGSVREPRLIGKNPAIPAEWFYRLGQTMEVSSSNAVLDAAFRASQGIRTIDPHDKEEDSDQIEAARRHLQNAQNIYILGYGFEPKNSRRIGLDQLGPFGADSVRRRVMYTNINDHQAVNRRALKALLGSNKYPFSNEFAIEVGKITIQRSTRSVYEALASDFDDGLI